MVNIDTVYQRVLAIANKEQRGYITPQEFNLFANHAQMDIFEQYFYDINQFDRLPGNDTQYANPSGILEEKISIFKRRDKVLQVTLASTAPNGTWGDININNTITNMYRLGDVRVNGRHAEERTLGKQNRLYESNPLTRSSEHLGNYSYSRMGTATVGVDKIKIYPYPFPSDNIRCDYIKVPNKVEWGYVVVNGYAQYNGAPAATTDFELHPSEENNLVFKILQLSGLVMKDASLYQVAAQEEIKDIQQEKQ